MLALPPITPTGKVKLKYPLPTDVPATTPSVPLALGEVVDAGNAHADPLQAKSVADKAGVLVDVATLSTTRANIDIATPNRAS